MLVIVVIGVWALGGGDGHWSRVTQVDLPKGESTFTLMASRLGYGTFRKHVVPKVLSILHRIRRTPWVPITFSTTLGLVLIGFVNEITSLAETTTLLLLAVFTVVNIAVLVLRRDPVDRR